MDKKILNNLNILYVEDDPDVMASLTSIMSKIFKNLYTANDGQEALELFNQLKDDNICINAIISDINMPNMDGIQLLEQIRKIDEDLPFIFTTAYSETEYLLESIRLNTSAYVLKPFDLNELIEKVEQVCQSKLHQETIQKQKKQLERYLSAIDNVAIVSKTDANGKITFANDIFCQIAQYTREELYGQPHNIVRHPDMPAEAFKELWKTIKSGNSWEGKIKNMAKDGSAYYVNSTIIPLYDDMEENITEYIGIRFLTTDEEIEKREFKKRVLKNIQDTRKKQLDDANQIKLLEEKLKSYEHVDLIEDAFSKEKERTVKLKSQLDHYENELKSFKSKNENLVLTANEKVKKASRLAIELRGVNDKLSTEANSLRQEIHEKTLILEELERKVVNQSKIIKDLKDVIEHREDQLSRFKR